MKEKLIRVTKFLVAFGVCLCIGIIFQWWTGNPSEPEQCRLCDSADFSRYHAPCIYDLTTGLITEMSIYECDPTTVGRIAHVQNMNYNVFTFGSAGRIALAIDRNIELQRCIAYAPFPKDDNILDASNFCNSCRKLLLSVDSQAFVILDMYDLNAIKAYSVKEGAAFTLRDYGITISTTQHSYQIKADGHLYKS